MNEKDRPTMNGNEGQRNGKRRGRRRSKEMRISERGRRKRMRGRGEGGLARSYLSEEGERVVTSGFSRW